MDKREGSERQRVPQPLIKKRIASGRGATEQPNATGDEHAALNGPFWIALVLTGVLTGGLGAFLMWVLYLAENAAFNYHSGSYQAAVAAVSGERRVISLVLASLLGSLGWYLIRRFMKNRRAEIDDALWRGDGNLSFSRSILTSLVSELVIGMGASIGREAAPKLMGGASGSVFGRWLGLSPAQVRLLVACGGGAGLAAVYNVPLGGALFTAEVLYGSLSLPVVAPALVCTGLATFVGWLYLPGGATYADIRDYHFSASIMAFSLVAGLVVGLVAVVYVRAVGWASHHRASGVHLFWAMPLTFLGVGALGIWYPQLFGNGKDMAHQAFLGVGGAGLLFALFALKPLVTSFTLASGAAGGVFTPFLSTGAVLGGWLGLVWVHVWPGSSVGAYALVGAAAMIGASMQAPLAGLALVMEMTHSGLNIMVPMIVATAIATMFVRYVDGYSMYSARLPQREPE